MERRRRPGRAISIHTLTQRVTQYLWRKYVLEWHFNPHPHAEGDVGGKVAAREDSLFQSTPSRRG